MISIVSPVYNEAENLAELCKRVVESIESTHENFEFILVDNGSSDQSFNIIRKLREDDPRIKYVSLSRNFGHQGGIIAGLTHARGDAVITLDGDLQHPPELIRALVEFWKKGYEVVFTVKKVKGEKKSWHFLSGRFFYKLISSISELDLAYGQSDYRLLDRKVVDALLNIPEKNKFLRGMVHWVGFSQIGVEYEVNPRKRGRSKFSLLDYFRFAIDGIFSFSTAPLRIFLWIGAIIASFCIMYALYYLIMGFMNWLIPEYAGLLPPGSATLTVAVFFLSAVQLIGIGCLGEYIGRIYSQTKARPDFIVKDKKLD